jgi:hypothetical protein
MKDQWCDQKGWMGATKILFLEQHYDFYSWTQTKPHWTIKIV